MIDKLKAIKELSDFINVNSSGIVMKDNICTIVYQHWSKKMTYTINGKKVMRNKLLSKDGLSYSYKSLQKSMIRCAVTKSGNIQGFVSSKTLGGLREKITMLEKDGFRKYGYMFPTRSI